MDPKISRLVAGAVYGVQPKYKKKQGRDGEEGGKFTLHPAPKPSPEPSAEAADTEPLHVSKPEQGEAGGQIDLTA
jgi:hypothetical protein